jgi:hypothetical protein
MGVTFLVFIVIGAIIGYFKPTNLNKNEQKVVQDPSTMDQNVSYKGVVTNLGQNEYSAEKIDFALNDINGNEIILLRANDAKLSIAEGLFVTVTGRKTKTKDGKTDVLQVVEVVLKNDSD